MRFGSEQTAEEVNPPHDARAFLHSKLCVFAAERQARHPPSLTDHRNATEPNMLKGK
jgi:hypothetical protein